LPRPPGRLVERRAAECETGVVDEDVEAAELLHGLRDEALAAREVGDVELERDSVSSWSTRRAPPDLRSRAPASAALSRGRSSDEAPVTIARLPLLLRGHA
jgi:hypothetical protein